MIGAVDRHSTIPWLGHQGWFALLVDLFAVLVLLGVATALVHPQGAAAARGSRAAICGEADLILALIAAIVDHAAALARRRGSRSG